MPNPEVSGGELRDMLNRLSEVDLTSTEQIDFSNVLAVLGQSTELQDLVLNVNGIPTIRFPTEKIYFPSVTQISIRDNLINDWESVNELSRLPSLKNLIISQNPVLRSTTM